MKIQCNVYNIIIINNLKSQLKIGDTRFITRAEFTNNKIEEDDNFPFPYVKTLCKLFKLPERKRSYIFNGRMMTLVYLGDVSGR